jgi:hypothetical protein
MHLTAGLLADYANMTADGKLNVMGVFDRIITDTVPITHAALFLVVRFEARVSEGSGHSLQIALVDADGQEVVPRTRKLPLTFSMNGPGRPLTAQLIAEFGHLQLPVFGEYDFHLHVDGEFTASIPLYVEQEGG